MIVFVMQSIEHFLCYGKRILAARLGLDVHDRLPSMTPTAFGLERVQGYAKMLGPWPGKGICSLPQKSRINISAFNPEKEHDPKKHQKTEKPGMV